MQWKKEACPYLKTAMRQVQNAEQTQEVRISEGMPDIDRVVGAWGQCVLRTKQLRGDELSVSGGVSAWVMYLSENDPKPYILEAWLPFQLRWSVNAIKSAADVGVKCLLKALDARMLSAGKILLRADIAVLAEGYERTQADIFVPTEEAADVQMQNVTYPVVLTRECGEKNFDFEEEVSVPEAKTWLAWSFEPQITEQNVLGNRIVLRGTGYVRAMYLDEAGQVGSKCFELPFSRFIDLDKEYGKQASAQITLAVTGLDTQATPEGVRILCALSAQYVIRDAALIQITRDAYSPTHSVELTMQTLELPTELENRTEQIAAQMQFHEGKIVDFRFLPEFPTQFREGDTLHVDIKGNFRVLYTDSEGKLQSSTEAWTQEIPLPAAANTHTAVSVCAITPQEDGAQMTLRFSTSAEETLPMVTAMEIGQKQEVDPNRPTLILKRMQEPSLWELAKSTGSTVEAIQKANDLTGEAETGQMLLIPIV